MNKLFLLTIALFLSAGCLTGQELKLGLVKYRGGGDWYANPTALPNLAAFCNRQLNTNFNPQYAVVDPAGVEIFNVPFLHITGHGNIIFDEKERANLRQYLLAGGFLHIDDNYGLDTYIRRELEKLFPEKELVELPFTHPIYHQSYSFKNGLPKIHLHDNQSPQGFALLHEGRVIVFYSYESDLGDGWEDPAVHNDTEDKHIEALKMGANIIEYALHH
ncbi:MAG: DUF4159 domain-containing protein [Salinivirgaceae bacterium]|jgi:hypothetical protein|nr:DUF4159 domain-containing protein [Salinivirgaceae bacterium]